MIRRSLANQVAQNQRCADSSAIDVKPSDSAPSTDLLDTLDQLAGLAAGGAVATLRHQRGDVRIELQACFDTLFVRSKTEPARAALDRALTGLRVATLMADQPLAETFQERARSLGASAAVLGRLSPAGEGDTLATLNARLTAMLGFVDRLTLQPAQSTARHLEQLTRQGFDTAGIVSLAQSASFVTCQARLLAGLRAFESAGLRRADTVLPSPEPLPGHHLVGSPPPVRGRFTVDALQWRPWLPAVDPRHANAEQQSLLDQIAPRARRSSYDRTLLHNAALRRPHAQLVARVANAPHGLPMAERVLAAVVASRIDGCTYGASMLGRIFISLTRQPEVIGTLFAQGVNVALAPRWRALADLAVDLNSTLPAPAAGRIQALRAAGLSELEILDALHAIAIAGWDHRLALTLGETVGPGQQ